MRTPDYALRLGRQRVIVEIKQLDPSDSDKRDLRTLRSGQLLSREETPGRRLRSAIGGACPQLRRLAKGRVPAVLVVYNNLGSLGDWHLEPHAILAAMYGLEQAVITMPAGCLVDVVSGPKKKVTPKDNTSLSAIAVLRAPYKQPTHVEVFHNVHAALPLRPDLARDPGVRHFTLAPKVPRVPPAWIEM